MKRRSVLVLASTVPVLVVSLGLSTCRSAPRAVDTATAPQTQALPKGSWASKVEEHRDQLFDEGKQTFREDTFGSEAFWGGKLGLHRAIIGEKNGGVGPGLTPRQALQLGLKVDAGRIIPILGEAIDETSVSLDDPDTTIALLEANAVVGVRAVTEGDRITSIGVTCALCHSTVDDSLLLGIGRRLDGWPNRDLDVGRIVSLSPDLTAFEQLFGMDRTAVEKVLQAWGPGRYDAQLNMDGKAFTPDGKTAAVLIPAAYGLAGQSLHSYSGWGAGLPYWNAYVANTQMYGMGTLVDRRLAGGEFFPLTEKTGFADKRDAQDLITSKLPGLHLYQVSIPAPEPPEGSFDEAAARRGEGVFRGAARCATCHVPPLFTEPGWPMHTADEIGIDDFHASRSPTGMYRTTPLQGLFARQKGGFYHDGRFPTYVDVIDHYDGHFNLNLSSSQKADLVEYLKSL